MLEFIVLGNVPGTHFTITYSWVLILAAIFLMVLELRYHKQYALKVQALTTTTAEPAVVRPRPTKSPSKKTARKRTTIQKNVKASKKTTTKKQTRRKA